MRLGILGPLSLVSTGLQPVWDEEANSAPSAPKLRSVLTTLLVHADNVVPVPSLMSELWGDSPPSSGLTTLQTYILGLRRLLTKVTRLPAATVSREVLVTRAGGYLFQSDSGTLDVHRYHSLLSVGWTALIRGDDEAGVGLLSEALAQWRGPALVDVPIGPILESKRRQLEVSRQVLIEYLVDAQIRLGMYGEVLSELAAPTVENPCQEGMQAQYMRALYLSGRRSEALEVFQRLRRCLVAELGLEPSPALQRLHGAILEGRTDILHQLPTQRPKGEIIGSSAWSGCRVY
ncbi:AfsR/SARP family transcriptional regulator [Streptomyces sp. ST2-7A]|uniref:AfsR/SARP family transcriptional regulator n=1 Tax=Streptomyces sp. ST2-7A TaxID=2907214 RepID=UPI001F2594C6|nr:AfsR/SARP family transcriptional regulator [Streptomyces sp. ST2-7A]MCE7081091.1 AfsR/SARP family transcriptional regulator [Streptomyces sp. ST2-7A]